MPVAPTVTVVVKESAGRTLQYSSWERYVKLEASTSELTSEVRIKVEFLISFPNTPAAQRCVINLSLDFGLPHHVNQGQADDDDGFLRFIMTLSDYLTCQVSIEFVDFLLAKVFLGVVEEWFGALEPVPRSSLMTVTYRNRHLINSVAGSFARLGVAAFIAAYAWFGRADLGNFQKAAYAISIGFCTWAVVAVIVSEGQRSFRRYVGRCVLPSVILLSEGDNRAFATAKARSEKSVSSVVSITASAVLAIVLNVAASYLFVFFHG